MSFDSRQFKENLHVASDYLWPLFREFRKDFQFFALKQWNEKDVQKLNKEMRPSLVFDLTRPTIKAVTGAEMTSRFVSKFLGFNVDLGEKDRRAAEVFNFFYTWLRKHAEMEHFESLAFQDLCVCGFGCLATSVEYGLIPDGQILTKRIPVFNMGFDPTAIAPNLLDTNWRYIWQEISEEEFVRLYGEEGKDILEDVKGDDHAQEPSFLARAVSRLTGKGYEHADAVGMTSLQQSYNSKARTIKIHQYEWKDRVIQDRLVYIDPDTGKKENLFLERKETEKKVPVLNEKIEALNKKQGQDVLAKVEVQEDLPVIAFHMAIVSGGRKLREYDLSYKNFSVQFLTGEEDWSEYGAAPSEGYKKYFGLMRSMRDPQQFRNKFLSQAIHMFNSNPKGILIYEAGFFPNDEKMAELWNRADSSLQVEQDALQSAKPRFQHINQGVSFSGAEPLFQMASAGVHEAAGVNPSYTGGQATDLRRVAYSSVKEIVQQNLATLSQSFDSLRLYRKIHASLCVAMGRAHFSEEVLARIVGQNMAADVGLIKNLEVQDYDIVVDETPATPSPSHEVFTTVMQAMPQMLEVGFPLPSSLFKYIAPFLPPDAAEEWEQQIQEFYAKQAEGGEEEGEEGEEVPEEESPVEESELIEEEGGSVQ